MTKTLAQFVQVRTHFIKHRWVQRLQNAKLIAQFFRPLAQLMKAFRAPAFPRALQGALASPVALAHRSANLFVT